MNKIINPQIENGHTDIANEIMDALAKIRIPGEARQVLDFILRKTYGWHKKEDHISLSQFINGTGMKKSAIYKAIKKLKTMNLIGTKKDTGFNTSYWFNKNYNLWKRVPKKDTVPKKVPRGTKKGTKKVPKKRPTKENTKETNKRKYGEHVFLTDEEYQKLCKKFTKPITDDWIERANLYAEKIGIVKFNKNYISHYATILTWDRMKKERDGVGIEPQKTVVLVEYKGVKMSPRERSELIQKEKANG